MCAGPQSKEMNDNNFIEIIIENFSPVEIAVLVVAIQIRQRLRSIRDYIWTDIFFVSVVLFPVQGLPKQPELYLIRKCIFL